MDHPFRDPLDPCHRPAHLHPGHSIHHHRCHHTYLMPALHCFDEEILYRFGYDCLLRYPGRYGLSVPCRTA